MKKIHWTLLAENTQHNTMARSTLLLTALILLLAHLAPMYTHEPAPLMKEDSVISFFVNCTASSDNDIDNDCREIENPCTTLDHVFSMATQVDDGGDGVDIEINVAGSGSVHNNVTISPDVKSFTVQAWKVSEEDESHIWAVRDSGEDALFTIDATVHTKLQKFEMVQVNASSTHPTGVVQINGHMSQTRVIISGSTFEGCGLACISLRDGSIAELLVREMTISGMIGPGIDLHLSSSNTVVNIEDCIFHMNLAARNGGGGGLSVAIEPTVQDGAQSVHNNVVNILRTKFSNNEASFGGALYARIANIPSSNSPANCINVTDCTFVKNNLNHQVPLPMGGAVFIDIDQSEHPTEVNFDSTNFVDNIPLRTPQLSDAHGGALAIRIHKSHRTSVVVEQCIFVRNSLFSGSGGAIYAEFNSTRGATFDLHWSLFNKNEVVNNYYYDASSARGGALALVVTGSSESSVKIDHVDFEFNRIRSPKCIMDGSCSGAVIWAYVNSDLGSGSVIANSRFKRNAAAGDGLTCSILHREAHSARTLIFDRESCTIGENWSDQCYDPDVTCFGKTRNAMEVCNGQGVCVDFDQCRCNKESDNPECDPLLCPRGAYLNETECVECPEGTYDNRTDDQTGPYACAQCPPGSYSQTRGAHDSDTCQQCDPGTISSEPGAAECVACNSFQTANDDQTACVAGGAAIWLVIGIMITGLVVVSLFLVVPLAVFFFMCRLRLGLRNKEELKPLVVRYSSVE